MKMLVRALAIAAVTAACGASDIVVAPEPTSTTTAAPADPSPTTSTTANAAAVSPATAPTEPPTGPPVTTLPDEPPALLVEGSPMIRFSVEVGDGVELTRDGLARFVVETLADDRSWVGRGAGFELLDDGGQFTLIVALPDDVDRMCAPLQTVGRFSCARNGWIALNSLRWFGATDDWPSDLDTYRRYLVNHEVGHYIVGPNHESCPGAGEPAPIMMQQTKGLAGCLATGWVDP